MSNLRKAQDLTAQLSEAVELLVDSMTEDDLRSMSVEGAAKLQHQLKTLHENIDSCKSAIGKKFDFMRKAVVPDLMEDHGYESVVVTGVGRVGLRGDAYAGIKAGKKEEAFDWLLENDYGDCIQETVNAGTLKSLLKKIKAAGDVEVPEDLFKYEPYTQAVITKA